MSLLGGNKDRQDVNVSLPGVIKDSGCYIWSFAMSLAVGRMIEYCFVFNVVMELYFR